MYFCYLDESGVPERSGQTTHFVLLGIAIPATFWKTADQNIERIKARYGLLNVEIHTGYIARRYPEQENIKDFSSMDSAARRLSVKTARDTQLIKAATLKGPSQVKTLKKLYIKSNDYIHLDFNQRTNLLRALADEIGSWGFARIFADALDKTKVAQHMDVFDMAFEQVVSRFHTFLSNKEYARTRRAPNIETERNSAINCGLLIEDNNETRAKKLTAQMRRFHGVGTWWTSIDRIIETPLFVDSSITSMVQVADICAYATRRFFEKNEDDLFNRIYNRFETKGNKLVGIRHYTGANVCLCKVCKAHGRTPPPMKIMTKGKTTARVGR